MKALFSLFPVVTLLANANTGFAAHAVLTGRITQASYTVATILSVSDIGQRDFSGTELFSIQYARSCNEEFIKVIETPLNSDSTLVGVIVYKDPSVRCQSTDPIVETVTVPLHKELGDKNWTPIESH